MSRPKLLSLFFAVFLIFIGITANLWASGSAPGQPLPFPTRPKVVDEAEIAAETLRQTFLPALFAPGTGEAPPWLDTGSRSAVEQFYLVDYRASEGIAPAWTGNHGSCSPGTTSAQFQDAVLRRINYFRRMSGIPPVTGFKAEYNQKAQAAALIMSVNNQLSHTPPASWDCFSDDGYEGASSSNLFLGIYGAQAISGYIADPGDGNYFVGHRRWILYPQTQYMGTGDVPPTGGHPAANALWVFDDENIWGERPETRDDYVAWPPPGYVPRQVVYPRWSFAYPGADFSAATVSMSRNGQAVAVTVRPVATGFGENTIVWEPNESIPNEDTTYSVTLQNVIVEGSPRSFSYEVITFTAGD